MDKMENREPSRINSFNTSPVKFPVGKHIIAPYVGGYVEGIVQASTDEVVLLKVGNVENVKASAIASVYNLRNDLTDNIGRPVQIVEGKYGVVCCETEDVYCVYSFDRNSILGVKKGFIEFIDELPIDYNFNNYKEWINLVEEKEKHPYRVHIDSIGPNTFSYEIVRLFRSKNVNREALDRVIERKYNLSEYDETNLGLLSDSELDELYRETGSILDKDDLKGYVAEYFKGLYKSIKHIIDVRANNARSYELAGDMRRGLYDSINIMKERLNDKSQIGKHIEKLKKDLKLGDTVLIPIVGDYEMGTVEMITDNKARVRLFGGGNSEVNLETIFRYEDYDYSCLKNSGRTCIVKGNKAINMIKLNDDFSYVYVFEEEENESGLKLVRNSDIQFKDIEIDYNLNNYLDWSTSKPKNNLANLNVKELLGELVTISESLVDEGKAKQIKNIANAISSKLGY